MLKRSGLLLEAQIIGDVVLHSKVLLHGGLVVIFNGYVITSGGMEKV